MITFSLIHATRGRPDQAIQTFADYMKKAHDPTRVEYILVVDSDDTTASQLSSYNPVISPAPSNCIKAWNAGAALSNGDILFAVSDDCIPPQDWDNLLEESLKGIDPQTTQKSLWLSDGHRTDNLMCWFCITRARYNHQGYLFCPEYTGVFADNEHTLRSHVDGVVIDARHIVFVHNHPAFGTAPMDETYAKQNSSESYRFNQEAFIRRNKHLMK